MTQSARLSGGRTRALIAITVLGWLGCITALGVVLASSQTNARHGVEQRLVVRTASGAEFASLYVKDIFVREHQQASSLLSAREITPQAMERASSAAGVSTAVLLDREGRVLQVLPAKPALIGTDLAPKYPHLASAVAGHEAVSDVVPSAARGLSVVGFAEPFQTSSGRRVFSGAYIVSDTPLGAYLSHLLVTPGNRVYLVDANAVVIASNGPLLNGAKTLLEINPVLAARLRTRSSGSYRTNGSAQTYVSVPVAGTPWRMVVSLPNDGLYASVDGTGRWLEWSGLFGLGVAGLVIIALGAHLLRSRARLTALNTTLDRVGRIDSLTGLSNRRDIEERLATVHSFARRHRQSLAVLLIDIDHFKRVNDTLGHQVGDSVLVETARAIRSALRLEDSVGRWGGEEFLAVLPSTDAKGALSTAQRIRARVAEAESLAFDGDGLEPVTVTVGGAVWVSGDIDSLIKRADRALYAGKDAGRDTVVIGEAETKSDLAALGPL